MFPNHAINAIHDLIRRLSPVELHRLDLTARRNPDFLSPHFSDWFTLTPRDLELLGAFGDASVSLLGVASFHHSGYVREAAIKKLSQITTGAELPFLIIRLNDWVPNVRTAAFEAIRPRLKPEYCRAIVDNLPLFRRLEHAERVDHREIIDTITTLVQSDTCRPLLIERLNTDDRFLRREILKRALDPTKPDFEQLAKRALGDDDTVIRSMAAKRISAVFDGRAFESLLEPMKRDRYMPVRREALRIAVKLGPPGALSELRNALLDWHRSMRDESRYQLRKIGPFDVAEFYRAHLPTAEGRTVYAVVMGLGETGNATDDVLILPYTSHAIANIRTAALRGLAALRPNAHADIFAKALTDEAPRVSGQAVRILRRNRSFLNPARLWELLRSTPHSHVKRNAFHLIEHCSKWDTIPYLLNALCEMDETIVRMAQSAIDNWLGGFNKSFSSPTRDQLAATHQALERCCHLLDESTLERLQFSLKGF